MNHNRAVHRHSRDHVFTHQIDEDGIEAHFRGMRAHSQDHRLPVLACSDNRRDHGLKCLPGQNIRKGFKKFLKRAAAAPGRSPIGHLDFGMPCAEGIGAQPSKIQLGPDLGRRWVSPGRQRVALQSIRTTHARV